MYRRITGYSPALRRARSGHRLRVVLAVYLIITLALGWRLIDIQVRSAAGYREMARLQTERDLELPAERGKVYDRTGEPLAVSLPTATIVANPRQLASGEVKVDPGAVAAKLAPVLQMGAGELEAKLRRDKGFVFLARQRSTEIGKKVEALNLPGVQVLDEPRRDYPAGALASQIVGFAGTDHKGLSGLERQYDTLLAGLPGRMIQQRAPTGLEISSAPRVGEHPVAGTDLVLSIDREIQATTERLLAEAVKTHKADGATGVVLDVGSGEILAMAGMPSYHPDDIGEAAGYARRNRVVTDAYEPGSVNKLVTAAAALEEGVIGPKEKMKIGSSVTVGGKTFSDDHSPQRGTLGDIIRDSSNVGTIKLARKLGPEHLHGYLQRFGFGKATALAFPGETDGLLADPSQWSGTSLPTIAIGQGVSASLLQVAQLYATVARGGVYRDPVLVRGSVGSDGKLEPAAQPETRRVISQDTARVLSKMLTGVVDEGTGANAAVPGYRVAGKTGTAQKPADDGSGYEAGAYVGTFVGYAPAEHPEVVVAIAVDEPREGYYGGTVAAPVFSELLRFTLGHRRVPPTDDVGDSEPQV
jgi:cell division protein FtsI (penicillin-binding protein 3)